MEELMARYMLGGGPLDSAVFGKVMLEQTPDIEEIFRLIWNSDVARGTLAAPVVYGKSVTHAEKARLEGNTLYKAGLFGAAMENYNLSILLSPHPELEVPKEFSDDDPDSESLLPKPRCHVDEIKKYKTLGLAYANRSAVFFSQKKYDCCLVDIDMAIKYGYPEDMRKKLEERRGRCLKAKEDSTDFRANLFTVSMNRKTPPSLKEVNPSIPVFSSSLEVAYSEAKGRHVIAAKDIPPGEVIAVEGSYSSVFHKPDESRHCLVCLLEVENRIPCPNCPLIFFCSEKCRAKGLKEHMRECNTYHMMHSVSFEDDKGACVAMKLVVDTTFAELKEKDPLLKKESKEFQPKDLGFDENGKFTSADYRSVYHMATRTTEERRQLVLEYGMKALFLTKILHQSRDFFVTKEGLPFRPTDEDFILTGTALLRYMLNVFPVICISDIKVGPVDRDQTKDVVAHGVYPSLALMRNSCNPPTVFYNFGRVKIMRTVAPITAGQEVTMSYIGRYQTMPLPFRWGLLQKMGFNCSCEPCVKRWPPLPLIPNDLSFGCFKCGQGVSDGSNWQCHGCRSDYNKKNTKTNSLVTRWWKVVEEVHTGFRNFEQITRKLEMGQPATKKDYDTVCNFSRLINNHLKEPANIFLRVRNTLLMFFFRDV